MMTIVKAPGSGANRVWLAIGVQVCHRRLQVMGRCTLMLWREGQCGGLEAERRKGKIGMKGCEQHGTCGNLSDSWTLVH